MWGMFEHGCPYAHKLGFFTKTDFNNNNRINSLVGNNSGGYVTTSVSKSSNSVFDYSPSGMLSRSVMYFNPPGWFISDVPTGSEDNTQSAKTWAGIFQSSTAGSPTIAAFGNSRTLSIETYYPQNSSGYMVYFNNFEASRRYSRRSPTVSFPAHQVHSYNGSSSLARAYISHNDTVVANYNTMLANPVTGKGKTETVYHGHAARTHTILMFYRHFDVSTELPYLNGYLKYLRRG